MSALALPRAARTELACFAALASLCVLQWVALVEQPPLLGAAVAVAAATAAGAALAGLANSRRRLATRLLAGAAVSALALALGLALVGVPAWMLAPAQWGELASRLGDGLDGAGSVSVPYDGRDRWTRLAILVAAPLALVLAAVAGFGPSRRRARGRIVALALLLALYTVMAAWRTPESYLGPGIIVLALIAAWLWLPSLNGTALPRALAALCVAAVAAAPLVLALERDDPLVDYRSWRLFGTGGIGFDWDHSYGPMDWPQRGTLLFTVTSDGAHYWKAENLDRFDGVGWSRSPEPGAEPALGQPSVSKTPGLPISNPWVERINFEIRGLRSDVVIGAGTTLEVDDARARPTLDAIWTRSESFERGDEYTVLTYAPDPSPSEMRGASVAYPREARRYTTLGMPGGRQIRIPLWDREPASGVADQLAGTPYERVYALSRRLVSAAVTPYDAAAAIEAQLRARYRYDQEVPEHEYPLAAFLFEDRSGYCQQFSGAMALMLRMSGIPTRVAGGFSPGGVDPERGNFRVEDVDAHSWVEVFFPRIGWVPFDPTPTAAPAEAQLGETSVAAPERGGGPTFTTEADAEQPQRASDAGRRGRGAQERAAASEAPGPNAGPLAGGAALGLAALGALLYAARAIRRRLVDPERLAAAELAELRSALERLGWDLDPPTTLSQLERRLASAFGREAWLYAVRLRERRFRDPSLSPPGARQRRRLRRAVLARAGARGLLALPPGGPALRA